MNRLYCAVCGSSRDVALVREPITPICVTCYRRSLAAYTEQLGGVLYRLSEDEWREFAILRGKVARRVNITNVEADRLLELEGFLVDHAPLTPAEDEAARRIVSLALGG